MSAAKIAASLRDTGWTGTFGSSPVQYIDQRARRATFQASSERNLSVRFPSRLPDVARNEWPVRVDLCRLVAEGRTAGVGAQTGVQGSRGELPNRVDFGHSRFARLAMPIPQKRSFARLKPRHPLRLFQRCRW